MYGAEAKIWSVRDSVQRRVQLLQVQRLGMEVCITRNRVLCIRDRIFSGGLELIKLYIKAAIPAEA